MTLKTAKNTAINPFYDVRICNCMKKIRKQLQKKRKQPTSRIILKQKPLRNRSTNENMTKQLKIHENG